MTPIAELVSSDLVILAAISPPLVSQWVIDAFVWAGLHDDVLDRPSAKAAPVGCQLVTMILKIKPVTIPKGGFCTAEVVTQSGT